MPGLNWTTGRHAEDQTASTMVQVVGWILEPIKNQPSDVRRHVKEGKEGWLTGGRKG